MLYGWVHASDHQVIYQKASPHLVFSVDRGHFFPGGPDWQIGHLATAPAPQVDDRITAQCALSPTEIRQAASRLTAVTDQVIATAAAMPPDEWSISLDEKVAVASYLAQRRDTLLATLAS